MNRRRFITQLGSAVACFSILPSATTYARRWVKLGSLHVPDVSWLDVPNKDWQKALYRLSFFDEEIAMKNLLGYNEPWIVNVETMEWPSQ